MNPAWLVELPAHCILTSAHPGDRAWGRERGEEESLGVLFKGSMSRGSTFELQPINNVLEHSSVYNASHLFKDKSAVICAMFFSSAEEKGQGR